MSYKARDWALARKDLKPSAKIVLVQLATFHTDKLGCFPSQNRLAEECGISLRSLNRQLAYLEEKGLIRRIQRSDPRNKRYESTRYTFAFEESFQPKPSATLSESHVPERQTKVSTLMKHTSMGAANAQGVRNPDTVNPDTDRSSETGIDYWYRRMLRRAVGADPETGIAPGSSHVIGDLEDMMIAQRWRTDLGLTDQQIFMTIQKVMLRRSWQHKRIIGPINSLHYFTQEMQKVAGVLKALRNRELRPLDVMVNNFTFREPAPAPAAQEILLPSRAGPQRSIPLMDDDDDPP